MRFALSEKELLFLADFVVVATFLSKIKQRLFVVVCLTCERFIINTYADCNPLNINSSDIYCIFRNFL